MKVQMQKVHAHCRCGKVSLELVGRPILRATCYCNSCQAAAKILGDLPGAPTIAADDGGTDFMLYRKDRVGQIIGIDHLREHRLTPNSPMRRMVAECCNTPMAADFTKGFWLNIFAGCLEGGGQPRPTLRSYTAPFMARLVLSWAAMGFRRPKLTW